MNTTERITLKIIEKWEKWHAWRRASPADRASSRNLSRVIFFEGNKPPVR